jgi:hypothetical protein
VIANHLVGSSCRLIAEPESFLVLGTEGPLAPGEEERAAGWARAVARVAAGVDARQRRTTRRAVSAITTSSRASTTVKALSSAEEEG